ncbi:MAG: rubrerythrin family protein [Clostridiales bacterium]|nr:rubrerythrin family protein [Clostridiales bacterium]
MKKIISSLLIVLLTTMLPLQLFAAAAAQESETYANLYAAVQGETNANAAYLAFAEKALNEGYLVIARLFQATADAEAKHAEDEWAILQTMGATQRPVASKPSVGSTADNLLAAFNGETYEYQVMYPEFMDTAEAEGMNAGDTNARRIFNLAKQAEEIHAGNYFEVLTNLADTGYINSKYVTIYRCPVCGEVVVGRPGRCPICNADGSTFIEYSGPLSVDLSAYVTKRSGNQNDLTITIVEKFADNSANTITKTISINNNAAGKYAVGAYTVYVDTKGNTQIRECYLTK